MYYRKCNTISTFQPVSKSHRSRADPPLAAVASNIYEVYFQRASHRHRTRNRPSHLTLSEGCASLVGQRSCPGQAGLLCRQPASLPACSSTPLHKYTVHRPCLRPPSSLSSLGAGHCIFLRDRPLAPSVRARLGYGSPTCAVTLSPLRTWPVHRTITHHEP